MSALHYKLIFDLGKSRQKNKIRGKNLSTVVKFQRSFCTCSNVVLPFLEISLRSTFEFLWRIFLEQIMRFFDKLFQTLRNMFR